MTIKAYCVGGPMDMQVVSVKDDQRVISFATTPPMEVPAPDWSGSYQQGPEATIEVTKVCYHMVYRSHDGARAVYIAKEAL